VLVFSAVLGYIFGGNATLDHWLLDSAFVYFPIIGPSRSHRRPVGALVRQRQIGPDAGWSATVMYRVVYGKHHKNSGRATTTAAAAVAIGFGQLGYSV